MCYTFLFARKHFIMDIMVFLRYVLKKSEQDITSLLFEIKLLMRCLTHILFPGRRLETQVFLTDGSVWMAGLWKSHTPVYVPSLLHHRSASTVTYTNTQEGSSSHTATKPSQLVAF